MEDCFEALGETVLSDVVDISVASVEQKRERERTLVLIGRIETRVISVRLATREKQRGG